ncbi:ABC transporter ATP-binding protein [Corynebacterium pseudodiphtheriticum]|uniref:ABC transporter ATP-binding protein n=1 Tax=Corynebacterium pseudodiphtheriticum TaxID=37637 RepID=UPI00254CA30C|nr:ABC transporter ATP-binding protein [Corynebacterium pseudodiphtheriticum]MDK8709197.1 ABC transporter ATP-binding protein [Corynebacterium pseudodiphtheriticum]
MSIQELSQGGAGSLEIIKLVVIASIVILTGGLSAYFTARVSSNATYKLRTKLFEKYISFNINNVNNSTLTSQLLTNDIEKLAGFTAANAIKLPANLLTILVVIPLLVVYRAWVVLGLVFALILALISVKRGYVKLHDLQRKETIQRENLIRNLGIYTSHIRMMVINKTDTHIIHQISQNIKEIYDIKLQMARVKAWISPINQSLGTVLIVCYVAASLVAINFGLIDISQALNTSFYLLILLPSLASIATYVSDRPGHAATTTLLADLFDAVGPGSPKIKGLTTSSRNHNRIVNSAGTVSYESPSILSYKSIQAETGRATAIIGQTGTGKSTLLEVMGGLYKNNEHSLPSVDDGWQNYTTLYLPQKMGLPASTLSSCVSLICGTGKFEYEQFHNCLKRISIHEAEFENILERDVLTYSGGQQQRILFAIAVASNADVYLLDEPLASLDSVTAKIVLEELDSLANNSLVFYSTHGNPSARSRIYELEG